MNSYYLFIVNRGFPVDDAVRSFFKNAHCGLPHPTHPKLSPNHDRRVTAGRLGRRPDVRHRGAGLAGDTPHLGPHSRRLLWLGSSTASLLGCAGAAVVCVLEVPFVPNDRATHNIYWPLDTKIPWTMLYPTGAGRSEGAT